MISAGTPNSAPGEESIMQGSFFPYRLTATLSALKIVCGCMLVGLGAAAMVQKAGYAGKATGISGGVVVIISGVLGAYAVRTNATRVYVMSFLLSCICSLVASVVIIIYSATGLAKDANQPYGVRRDEEGNIVPIGEQSRPSREAAMLINTMLIIIGFLDVIFSLPSIIINLRELCQCYNPALLLPKGTAPSHVGGVARKDWLMSWLGQQTPIFYSQTSGIPYAKLSAPGSPFRPVFTTRATPPFIHIPSEPSHSVPGSRHSPKDVPQPRQRQRSKSPNPRHHHSVHPRHQYQYHTPMPQHPTIHPGKPPSTMMHQPAHFAQYPPMEMFTPFYPHYPPPPSHPSPNSNMSHPSVPHMIGIPHPMTMHGHPQWVYGPADWDSQIYPQERHRRDEKRRQRERDQRKRSRSKSQPKEAKRKRRKGPTDSDIERTYTGMDRELAEEFIEQTMDPAVLIDQTMSGTESEAW